jgi:hypothetical protein
LLLLLLLLLLQLYVSWRRNTNVLPVLIRVTNAHPHSLCCCCLQALWRRHTNTPSSRRHLYEVVQAGCPCHLYFDLEYSTAANPGACGDALVNVLVGLVREEYARLWGIDIRKQVGGVLVYLLPLELDLSTAAARLCCIIILNPAARTFELEFSTVPLCVPDLLQLLTRLLVVLMLCVSLRCRSGSLS